MDHVDLKAVLTGIRSGGCVQPYLSGFANELISEGYVALPIRDYIRSATHLGRWMDLRSIGIERLGEAAITRFSRHKCQCPLTAQHGRVPSSRNVKRARRFVMYLVHQGVIPPLPLPTPKVVATQLDGFRTWMIRHRGVKERTVERHERLIEKMLPALGSDPGKYDAALVRRVLLQEINQLNRGYAKTYLTALRMFLRFLAAHGRCQAYLDRALPIVPEWKLSALPRYLETNDIERIIASCDLRKPHGVRDRAILLLLARLGLRGGDITAMRLGDLDWDAGTIKVLGKARREVCLPLPQDAGEALIDYLVNVRPQADTDRVFLCTNAPVRPFASACSVSDVVRFALQRAGIANAPSKGAHLLRHSAATTMLRSGASLDAIATVLRHQSTDTTAYYAKVDIEMLSKITQPWPEEDNVK